MMRIFKNILDKVAFKPAISDSLIKAHCKIINGSFQVSQCTINESLQINGGAELGQNTHIKKTMTINGQLGATGTIFEDDIVAHGTSNISHALLKRKGDFSGNLTARDCRFLDTITLLTHKSTFINCQLNNIINHKLPYVNTSQSIHFYSNCVVNGDIRFESGNGEVFIDESTQINGEVYGGKIIFI